MEFLRQANLRDITFPQLAQFLRGELELLRRTARNSIVSATVMIVR